VLFDPLGCYLAAQKLVILWITGDESDITVVAFVA
jgi:hypothetical protein